MRGHSPLKAIIWRSPFNLDLIWNYSSADVRKIGGLTSQLEEVKCDSGKRLGGGASVSSCWESVVDSFMGMSSIRQGPRTRKAWKCRDVVCRRKWPLGDSVQQWIAPQGCDQRRRCRGAHHSGRFECQCTASKSYIVATASPDTSSA